MPHELDRLPDNISCVDADSIPFTLISTLGFHCDVWRSIGRLTRGESTVQVDCVLKIGSIRCTQPQVRALAREHHLLKSTLGELIPDATFVAARVNREPRALVLAEACQPWFDLGNPTNETEALPMLANTPRLHRQMRDFTHQARRWLDEKRMVIDLIGSENLVLDRSGGLRYLDSFHVFFYLDTLDAIEEVDDAFLERVEQSVERLSYLEWLVTESSALRAQRANQAWANPH